MAESREYIVKAEVRVAATSESHARMVAAVAIQYRLSHVSVTVTEVEKDQR